jgi:drug/metabolite transporter (DMT)-like permease
VCHGRSARAEPPSTGETPVAHGMASQRSAYLLMLISAAAFATMSACGHGLAGRCDWRLVAIARGGIAFALTACLARSISVRVLFHWPRTLWMRSVVGSFSLLFTFYTLSRLPVATAVTLFNTFPIWVTLLAWPVLGERPTAAFLAALTSGVAGVVLIEHGETSAMPESVAGSTAVVRFAIVCALCAALCTAIVMLGLHRLRTINSLAIVVHFSGVATLAVIGFVVVTILGGWPIDFAALADPLTIVLLLAVGGFSTIGQIAMTRAFSLGQPQRLAIVGLTQVVFALGFDLGLWDYRLDAVRIAGLVLVLAPVAWLIGRRRA